MKTIGPEIREYIDNEMNKVYDKLGVIEKVLVSRIDNLENGLSYRIGGLENRAAGLEARMDGLRAEFSGLDKKMDSVISISEFIKEEYRDLNKAYYTLRGYIEKRFDDLFLSINELKRDSKGETGFGQPKPSNS